jgi:Asp-tRNA(Asn)/Glu-tRNA(Gln) amidotransferase A subunit family amidase
MDFQNLTVKDLRAKLDRKEISAPELTKAYLKRISEKDPLVKSFITVVKILPLEQAGQPAEN